MVYSSGSGLASLLGSNPQDFYSRLIQLTNSLNQISAGFSLSTVQPRSLSPTFDTPMGMEFRLDGKVAKQGARNAQEALSALSSVSTSLTRQSAILGELKDLATTAADSATTVDEREQLNVQATALVKEYNDLNSSTSYNKQKLLDGSLQSFDVQLGYGSNQFKGSLNTYTTRQVADDYSAASATSSGIAFLGTPQGFARGDLNGDGADDVLIQDSPGLSNKIYAAVSTKAGVNGSGTEKKIVLSGNANDVALTDVNGDGAVDALAATSSGLEVAYGNGDGTFGSASILHAGDFASVNVTDINGDGTTDIVGVAAAGDVTTLTGSGGGSYTAATVATGVTGITSAVTGDINGDGYGDVAFIDSTGALYSRLGAADGSLGSQQLMGNAGGGTGSYELSAGEFNGDAKLDFVVSGPSTNAVFFGQGDRTITSVDSTALSAGASGFSIADLNGDGRDDIVAHVGSSNAEVYHSDGAGSFTTTGITLGASSVGIADTNGDGALDIIGGKAGGYVTRTAETKTTTDIPYLNLNTQAGSTAALSAIDTLQTNIELESASVNGSKNILTGALASLNTQASVNFATANMLKDAYAERRNGADAIQSAFSQSQFVSALIRSLLA